MGRDITHRYIDPLAQIWLSAAQRIGLRIDRTRDAYAATDGRGTLAIATDENLDDDDSLAQMIFHELCHSLVEGEDSFRAADWGMDNTGPDHDWREHACLRVQWVLAGRHGLRGLFAPTTDFRTSFWNQLSKDVLADRADRSTHAAIVAIRRADQPPWAPALSEALAATAQLAALVPRVPGTLWSTVVAPPARHPTGLPASDADGTCGTCAWRAGARCRQAEKRVDEAWPACERFEVALDCQTCGACCRASVSLGRGLAPRSVREEAAGLHRRSRHVSRDQARRRSLQPRSRGDKRYLCVIYDDRPRTCRDFTLGSAHCLTARRRVGLSL